ncbi:hypothetical protein RVR_3469 [Actinacidiphila reveromycinica]|uniref:Uncharacterized protein n=1 Tax=Actinacidiphila reveromycinica TaxID=659352 RepID=A0A7U3US45_9ACTN|nr:hypothetical protein [Streptomyces sp. SN-593]BBA97638.1 hypothetical protein RVR_3469 [Streptomyces sp. SN-593]
MGTGGTGTGTEGAAGRGPGDDGGQGPGDGGGQEPAGPDGGGAAPPPGRRRRTRNRVLALTVLLVLVAVVAVVKYRDRDKGTPYVPPRAGQASILLTPDQAGSGLDLNTIRTDDGMAFGPDGSLYVLRTDLFRITPDRQVSRVWRAGAYATGGLAVLPDGTVAVGVRGGVLRIDAHGKASTLAGSPDPAPGKDPDGSGDGKDGDGKDGGGTDGGGTDGSGARDAAGGTGTAGSTAAATGFVGVARPLGTRPDGALVVQDSTAVWAARGGAATKVLDTPVAGAYLDDDTDTKAVRPTADAEGDAYFVPTADPGPGLARRITRVTPSGKATQVAVPRTIPGLPGGPGGLTVQSLAGDGADGVYVDAVAGDSSGSGSGLNAYVVHLHDGTASVVAHSRTAAHGLDCALRHPVGALDLPCALPNGMAYHDGRLALDGMVHYTLEVSVS